LFRAIARIGEGFGMKKTFLTAAIAPALLAAPLAAQSVTGLDPIDITTFAYDRMESWTERDVRPAGVVEMAEVEGMIFFDVRGIFNVPWSDDLSRLSISSSDILLVLDDGTEIKPFGAYEYWGMMHLNPRGASVSRPRDFPEGDADLYWHSLFLVPEGTASATLRLSNDEGLPGYEGTVTVPKISQELQSAVLAEFSVVDEARFRSLATIDGRDTQRVTMTMDAPPGYIFADIEVEIAPLAANEFDDDPRYYWHTYDFRLVGLDGTTFHPIGERFQDKILDYQFSGANPGDSATRRMVWMVPEDVAEATLMFGSVPVTPVTLASAIADQG